MAPRPPDDNLSRRLPAYLIAIGGRPSLFYCPDCECVMIERDGLHLCPRCPNTVQHERREDAD